MRSCRLNRRQFGGLLAGVLLCPSLRGLADTPAVAPDATSPAANQALTLQACRQIALGQQPSLAAAQASLKAAIDRANAVQNLRVPGFLARDLPIRRKQAALGVTIAEGGRAQAEAVTLHGVTYSYLAALHAAQQMRMADEEIRPRLNDLMALVSDPETLKRRRDVLLAEHQNLVKSFLETLDGRVQEGKQGQKRAEAALREAMGVGPDFVLTLPKRDLPCPRVHPQLDEIVALALARRGELVQVYTLVEVICLEIDAQAASCKPNMRTFASGSDIHAKPLPSGDTGGIEYRPAIVGPEMPAFLTGSRDARVQQARDYHQRAQAVAAKARNLIVLEVEDLYRRWLNKSRKATHLETAYREARTFSERLKESFNKRMPSYPNIDEVINAGLVTTRLQLEWKEAHYQSLLALAALERATAGGFQIDFDTAAACGAGPKELPAEPLDKP
ncbi:MAG TPA: TolC family protein [Gemmataceae bacterium]|nr:TolC family protein [Gemmataceae bacterium]